MKYIFLVSVFIIVSTLLFAQQKRKAARLNSVELESFSRRLRTHLHINTDSIVYTSNGAEKRLMVSKKQWQNITQYVAKLKLDKMPAWPAPTNKRAMDAAMHCRVKIKAGGTLYESQYFDCGAAPKSLKQLYALMEQVQQQLAEEELP
jgi:hypothetical protein